MLPSKLKAQKASKLIAPAQKAAEEAALPENANKPNEAKAQPSPAKLPKVPHKKKRQDYNDHPLTFSSKKKK